MPKAVMDCSKAAPTILMGFNGNWFKFHKSGPYRLAAYPQKNKPMISFRDGVDALEMISVPGEPPSWHPLSGEVSRVSSFLLEGRQKYPDACHTLYREKALKRYCAIRPLLS